MLTTIERSALVPHTAEQMFSLVNDVEAYPEYLDDCRRAKILEQGEDYMVARLDLRKAGVSYSFTTRNTLLPPHEIRLALHSGPFKQLRGNWHFQPLGEDACKVRFHLEFEVSNKLMSVAANSLFAHVANQLVAALTERARVLYGNGQ